MFHHSYYNLLQRVIVHNIIYITGSYMIHMDFHLHRLPCFKIFLLDYSSIKSRDIVSNYFLLSSLCLIIPLNKQTVFGI